MIPSIYARYSTLVTCGSHVRNKLPVRFYLREIGDVDVSRHGYGHTYIYEHYNLYIYDVLLSVQHQLAGSIRITDGLRMCRSQ